MKNAVYVITYLLVLTSSPGFAFDEPAPVSVLFRINSAEVISGSAESLQIHDPQLQSVCSTRGTKHPSLVFEGRGSAKTLYMLPVGNYESVIATLQDLRGLSAVAEAQPNHFLVIDQAPAHSPPQDLYFTRDYEPFPPFSCQDSLDSVFWPITPHNWEDCTQYGFTQSHLTFYPEDYHLTDQWPIQMTQTDLA